MKSEKIRILDQLDRRFVRFREFFLFDEWLGKGKKPENKEAYYRHTFIELSSLISSLMRKIEEEERLK